MFDNIPRNRKLKIFLCIELFLVLCNAIPTKEDIFANTSCEDKELLFGTTNCSVPDFEIGELIKSTRSRRSAEKSLVLAFNISGNILMTTVKKVRDHDLIGPTKTGIWFADYNTNAFQNVTYTPRPDFFENIGYLEFFHNLEDRSAITKFWTEEEGEIFNGIMKENYTVKSLPKRLKIDAVELINDHVIRKRSAEPMNDPNPDTTQVLVIFETPQLPQNYLHIHENSSRRVLHRSKREDKKIVNPPKVVYPKLLLSPDYGLLSVQSTTATHFVRGLIAMFNIVDMMYRQLQDPEVRIEIAGIIIPRDNFTMPYIERIIVDGKMSIKTNAVNAGRAYFRNEYWRFPFDTFNIVLILTSMDLGEIDKTGSVQQYAGYSSEKSACGRASKLNGGSIVISHSRDFQGIATMAHELGHILGSSHDGEETKCSDEEGYLMSASTLTTLKLSWSSCSKNSLSIYLKSSKANCLHNRLVDVPDAIKSMQGTWLSLRGQCQNLFQDSDNFCLPISDVNQPPCDRWACQRGPNCDCNIVKHPPMEGAFCSQGKRCINKLCVDF